MQMFRDNIKKACDRIKNAFNTGDSRQQRRQFERDLKKRGVPANEIEHILFAEDNRGKAKEIMSLLGQQLSELGWKVSAGIKYTADEISPHIRLVPMAINEYNVFRDAMAKLAQKKAEKAKDFKAASKAEEDTMEKLKNPNKLEECEKAGKLCGCSYNSYCDLCKIEPEISDKDNTPYRGG